MEILFNFITNIFHKNVNREKIIYFIRSRLDSVYEMLRAKKQIPLPAEIIEDLVAIQMILIETKLVDPISIPQLDPQVISPSLINQAKALNWIAELSDGKVIHKGYLRVGTGKFLEWLAAYGNPEYSQFVKLNVEILLRHIEVKRNNAFKKFNEALTEDQVWLEQHDIAILFSKFTQRHRDLRMLNAAFKLNDWAFPYYSKISSLIRLVRFLRSLIEQEKAALELLE